jgi:hypothetical protein
MLAGPLGVRRLIGEIRIRYLQNEVVRRPLRQPHRHGEPALGGPRPSRPGQPEPQGAAAPGPHVPVLRVPVLSNTMTLEAGHLIPPEAGPQVEEDGDPRGPVGRDKRAALAVRDERVLPQHPRGKHVTAR